MSGYPKKIEIQAMTTIRAEGYNTAIDEFTEELKRRCEEISGEWLHNAYLDATKFLPPETFNHNAQKAYWDLSQNQRRIDIYIATAIRRHILEGLEEEK